MNLLIVNYHYFREEIYTSGIYPISKRDFNKQLDELGKHYTFISQPELVDCIKNKKIKDGNYCLITLDDGLKEQMDAFHLMQNKGIPSILYVPTTPILFNTVLDVHKLHYVRTTISDMEILSLIEKKYDLGNIKIDKSAMTNQYRYDDENAQKVKFVFNFVFDTIKRKEATNFLFSQLVSDETSFAKQLYMDEKDLILLASKDSLGSHGSDHIPLGSSPEKEAEGDILNSINYLETTTGTPILSFSYPFGGMKAVAPFLEDILKQTNTVFALTTNRGINTISELNQPFFLNRIDTNDAPGGKNNLETYSPNKFVTV